MSEAKYQNVFPTPFEGDGYGDLSADVWRVTFCAFQEADAEQHAIYIIARSLSDAISVAEAYMPEYSEYTAIISVERFVGLLLAAPNIELVPNA